MKTLKFVALRIKGIFLACVIVDIPSCSVYIEGSCSIIARLLTFSLQIFKEVNRNFSNGIPDPSDNSICNSMPVFFILLIFFRIWFFKNSNWIDFIVLDQVIYNIYMIPVTHSIKIVIKLMCNQFVFIYFARI